MQWTVRLEARTSAGEVTTTELVTFSRPAMVSTFAEVGLVLAETKALLAKLQASMLCSQVAEYAAQHRVCAACGALRPLKDRRTRRLQTLFGTVEIEAPRFKLCLCRLTTPKAGGMLFSPVCALLTARCTPELERVQAELGARTSFRDGARILEALLPVSPANHESLRSRTHAVALQLEATDRQATAEDTAVRDDTDKAAAADASRPVVMLDGAYICAVPGHQVRNGSVKNLGHYAASWSAWWLKRPRRPCGQTSARPISPPRASRLPQVFDTPVPSLHQSTSLSKRTGHPLASACSSRQSDFG